MGALDSLRPILSEFWYLAFNIGLVTWTAVIPTKECMTSSNTVLSGLVNTCLMSIPFGVRTASHLSMASANTGMRNRAFPIPFFWDPIPENENQRGLFRELSACCNTNLFIVATNRINYVDYKSSHQKRRAMFNNFRRHFIFLQKNSPTKLSENFTDFFLCCR